LASIALIAYLVALSASLFVSIFANKKAF